MRFQEVQRQLPFHEARSANFQPRMMRLDPHMSIAPGDYEMFLVDKGSLHWGDKVPAAE